MAHLRVGNLRSICHLMLPFSAEVDRGDVGDDGGAILLYGLILKVVHHRIYYRLDPEVPATCHHIVRQLLGPIS